MVEQWLVYLLESSICLTVFYVLYLLILRPLNHFHWTRIYFLSVGIISIIFPLLRIPVSFGLSGYAHGVVVNSTAGLLDFNSSGAGIGSDTGFISPPMVLLIIYLAGALFHLLVLAGKLLKIQKIIKTHQGELRGEYRFFKTGLDTPTFSFLKNVFLNREQHRLRGEEIDHIIKHELVHVRQMHSLDVLFYEFLKILYWFNPAIRYMQKSLQENHEYIADSQMINQCEVSWYSKLIIKVATNRISLNLTNSFGNLQIKKEDLYVSKKQQEKNW